MRVLTEILSNTIEGFIVLRPLGDRVIIEVAKEEEKTVGGIVLASAAKEKPQTGTVIAVGEGRTLENGEKLLLLSTWANKSCSKIRWHRSEI